MLQDGRKCIGVFINRNDPFFFDNVCVALQQEAKRLGYDIYFFMTVGYFHSDSEYDRQEMTLFDQAPVENMDCIVLLKDLFLFEGLLQALMYTIESRVTCPIVHVRYVPEGCDGVRTDENHAMEDAVRHVIECHGCKRVAFMAGNEDNEDSELRLKCYRRVMAEYGLEVKDEYVMRGNMWYGTAEDAYDHYFVKHEAPEAIVCANDYMAIDLARALTGHGIKVPDDCIITGFDDIIHCANSNPSLTTIARDYPLMGREAIRLADRLIKEREAGISKSEPYVIDVPTTLTLRESCGCRYSTREEHLISNQTRFKNLIDVKLTQQTLTYFSINCCSCESIDDLTKIISRYFNVLEACRDLHICLFDSVYPDVEDPSSVGESDISLAISFSDGKHNDLSRLPIKRGQLLPAEIMRDQPQAYYIMMLHHGTDRLGYLAIQTDDDNTIGEFFNLYIVMVANVFQSLRNTAELKRISAENYLSSITDPMTGISNRRGFNSLLAQDWEEKCRRHEQVAFICIDVDGLKYINDTFGHEAGDRAICLTANALSSQLPENGIAARTGGDEFEVFLPDCSDAEAKAYVARVHEQLELECRASKYKFDVGISDGIYITVLNGKSTPQECMRSSDLLMYRCKRMRYRDSLSAQ